ncbi:nacht and ankyrin domain protein [Colletotrichum camelliae]|nr:nacht and ankyrin domain protein [Colletotrichum camelliae]
MPNLEEYTIGWICAINTEFVAARAFLDESHGKPEGVAQNDDNNYALGRMGKHNVVIAVLPKGEYGTTTAATVARNMVHSFPNVRIGLMVGIAGGAPSEKHDIRLGDIVVSSRGGGMGGVFQYDYGKTLQNGSFVETGSLNQPPQVLLGAVNGLEADYTMDGHQLDSKVEEALKLWPHLRRSHSRPPTTSDRLYQPNVTHPPDSISDCLEACSEDPAQMVSRHERGEYDDNPAIHFGLIASGNQVIKNAQMRDRLAAEKVRGICDYSDTHKNKAWQGFAAMVAAAYAKDVLGQISSTKAEMETRLAETLRSIEANQIHHLHTTNEVQTTVKEIRSKQQMKNIRRWLAPPDASTNANHARELRHKGTGEWFLESTAFREWISGCRRCLWLRGLPGYGKTVLLTAAYDHIAKKPDSVALQFFFDFGDKRKQTVDDMLRGLVFQLYTLQFQPSSRLDDIFKHCNDGRDQPDCSALSDCLQKMLKGSPTTYVFVDALDECSERAKLLKWMESFMTVTGLDHVQLISYVQSILKERLGFEKWISTPSMVQRISYEVGNKADGMFRWAACQLDSLESCIDRGEIEIALKSLPQTLNATYERILERIPDHRTGKSMRLLQFLVFAPRPFTLEEAMDIVAIRPEGFKAEDRVLIPEDLLQGPGLISIVETVRNSDYFWEDPVPTKEVHFAHSSVKEYLLRLRESFHPVHASISILKPHVGYLSESKAAADRLVSKEFPLLRFVVLEWMNFVRLAEEPQEIIEQAADILQDSNGYALWRDCDELEGYVAALIGASYSGLRDLIQQLLAETPTSDAHERTCVGALRIAAKEGHVEIVKLLLSRGTDIHSLHSHPNLFSRMPAIVGAARRGHREIVELLLDSGEDVNRRDECWERTALSAASGNGFQEIVELLLERGANVTLDWQALASASKGGYDGIVKLLLDHGADVNAVEGYCEGNPLLAALEWGHLNVARQLLEHGADVSVGQGSRWSNSSFNTLLENGAEVNSHSPRGNALTAAIRAERNQNQKEIVQLLLRNGADVNDQSTLEHTDYEDDLNIDRQSYACFTYDEYSPLSSAVLANRPDLVRLLLDHGSDVNGPKVDTWNTGEPLLLAFWMKEREEIIKLLIERGADPNQVDRNGRPILYTAVEHGYYDITRSPIQSGADINRGGFEFGEMVLVAFDRGNYDVAVYLLQKGVELNIPRDTGYLRDTLDLGFLDWIAKLGDTDLPELSEEISRLRDFRSSKHKEWLEAQWL